MALRPCAQPGCPDLVTKGRCSTHARGVERQRTTDAPWRKLYRTARWLTLRRMVLSAEPWCRACQEKGYLTPATDVDHIERHHGDATRFHQLSNLQGLCAHCHGEKTGRGE